MRVVVDGRAVVRVLVWAGVAVVAVGVAAVLARTVLGRTFRDAVWLLDPMGDSTIPTWYAAAILAVASLLLLACWRVARAAGERDARWWAILAGIVGAMSIDEVATIHEWSAPAVEGDGLLYYSWVLIGIPLVLLVGATSLPWLLRRPPALRTGLIIAGAIYVGGALGVEMVNASLDQAGGPDTLAYGLGTAVEEAMEVAGVLILIAVLRRHLAASGASVAIDLGADREVVLPDAVGSERPV